MRINRYARLLLVATVLLACVGCDQTTKALARDHLRGRGTTVLFADTVRLQYVENPGAFLSLGASLPHRLQSALFTFGAGTVLAATLLYAVMAAKTASVRIIALSLVCGGGIGNLIDRVRCDGYVTDFLNMGVGPLRTGIFNFADVALMAGIALLFFEQRKSGASLH